MWRGIELILQGRDPREAWLFTQRICGVCTTVHAITSVRAVENALGLEIPLNAQYIRNLILIAHALHDHIVHFYHLSALDWVDVTGALKADPKKAAAIADSALAVAAQQRGRGWPPCRSKVGAVVDSGQLGIFTNGYWGHPAMNLPPEVNLLAVSPTTCRRWSTSGRPTRSSRSWAARRPTSRTSPSAAWRTRSTWTTRRRSTWRSCSGSRQLFAEVRDFVQQVYVPDVIAVGAMYPEWLGYGAGVTNYLAVPDLPLDTAGTQFDLPGGTIMGGDLAT